MHELFCCCAIAGRQIISTRIISSASFTSNRGISLRSNACCTEQTVCFDDALMTFTSRQITDQCHHYHENECHDADNVEDQSPSPVFWRPIYERHQEQ